MLTMRLGLVGLIALVGCGGGDFHVDAVDESSRLVTGPLVAGSTYRFRVTRDHGPDCINVGSRTCDGASPWDVERISCVESGACRVLGRDSFVPLRTGPLTVEAEAHERTGSSIEHLTHTFEVADSSPP